MTGAAMSFGPTTVLLGLHASITRALISGLKGVFGVAFLPFGSFERGRSGSIFADSGSKTALPAYVGSPVDFANYPLGFIITVVRVFFGVCFV